MHVLSVVTRGQGVLLKPLYLRTARFLCRARNRVVEATAIRDECEHSCLCLRIRDSVGLSKKLTFELSKWRIPYRRRFHQQVVHGIALARMRSMHVPVQYLTATRPSRDQSCFE